MADRSAPGEFELIDRFFRTAGANRRDVLLGIGDDGAVLAPPAGQALVAVTDTLVEGRHFPADCAPASIGHRSLAVNLSDIAAMGATPAWGLLALTLPRSDADWLQSFSAGFAELAREHGVALIGGDTTSGALSVTVTLLGFVPAADALQRDGARSGDVVFVTGTPGDAARGLELELAADRPAAEPADHTYLRRRFLYPAPRTAFGPLLRPFASACIDVSDGLAADAGKLATASHCGLELDMRTLPLSQALLADVGRPRALQFALTGGDDYELCFTVPEDRLSELERQLPAAAHHYHRIGRLTPHPGLTLLNTDGQPLTTTGFDHFR